MSFDSLFELGWQGNVAHVKVKGHSYEVTRNLHDSLNDEQFESYMETYFRRVVNDLILEIIGRMSNGAKLGLIESYISKDFEPIPTYITPFKFGKDYIEGALLVLSPKEYYRIIQINDKIFFSRQLLSESDKEDS